MQKFKTLGQCIETLEQKLKIKFDILEIANFILEKTLDVYFRAIDGYLGLINPHDMSRVESIDDVAISALYKVNPSDQIYVKPVDDYLPDLHRLLTNVHTQLNIPYVHNKPDYKYILLQNIDDRTLSDIAFLDKNRVYSFYDSTYFVHQLRKMGISAKFLITKDCLCISEKSIERLIKKHNKSSRLYASPPFHRSNNNSDITSSKKTSKSRTTVKTQIEQKLADKMLKLLQLCLANDEDKIFTRTWIIEEITDSLSEEEKKLISHEPKKITKWLGLMAEEPIISIPEYATKKGRRTNEIATIAKAKIKTIISSVDKD